MNFRKKLNNFITLIAMTILLLTIPQISEAASYEKLIKNGYKISTLTRSKGGASGWNLSNGKKRYFCKARVAVMYVGKSGMAILISTTGRIMELDRAAFEAKAGGPNKNIPQLRDIKAGRIKARHVGRCSPVH